MPETMSLKAKKALEQWYKEQRDRNVVLDFQKELVAYCESDMRLLKEGCLTFKRLFEAQAGFNPFEHITIASACNRDLRMNRMIPNSIASEPVKGWRNRVNQSGAAIEWLTWCDHQQRQQALESLSPEDLDDHDLLAGAYPDHPHPSHRPYIQHAGNAGEYRIPTVGFVDGYCQNTHTVYEFHGCFWHGCPQCYPNRHEQLCSDHVGCVSANPTKNDTASSRWGQRGGNVGMRMEKPQRNLSRHPNIRGFLAIHRAFQPA